MTPAPIFASGFVAIFQGKRVEIYAHSLLEARNAAIKLLKVPRSKLGLLAVMLAEKDGQPVIHHPGELS